jgi:hypothetical protein
VALLCLLALLPQLTLSAEPTVVVAVEKNGESFMVDAVIDAQVPLETAWNVLIDFDHMASFLGNMTFSKVMSRNRNTLLVRQEGVARYGLLSFSFVSEREVQLDPMKRIAARNLSGTLKRMESEARIVPLEQGVQIRYHAEIVPDSLLARMFGKSFVWHEVNEQFVSMGREMMRRHSLAEAAGK